MRQRADEWGRARDARGDVAAGAPRDRGRGDQGSLGRDARWAAAAGGFGGVGRRFRGRIAGVLAERQPAGRHAGPGAAGGGAPGAGRTLQTARARGRSGRARPRAAASLRGGAFQCAADAHPPPPMASMREGTKPSKIRRSQTAWRMASCTCSYDLGGLGLRGVLWGWGRWGWGWGMSRRASRRVGWDLREEGRRKRLLRVAGARPPLGAAAPPPPAWGGVGLHAGMAPARRV